MPILKFAELDLGHSTQDVLRIAQTSLIKILDARDQQPLELQRRHSSCAGIK